MNQQAMVSSCDDKIISKIPSPRNTGTNVCQLYMPLCAFQRDHGMVVKTVLCGHEQGCADCAAEFVLKS